MSPPIIEIDITRHCTHWPDMDASIKRSICNTLSAVNYTRNAEISLVLADNDFVHNLNKTYRGKDSPTNVLSFQQDDFTISHLGDIIIAREIVEHEAKEQNKSFQDHVIHLTVHGTLHLLGFDHEEDKQAEEMEALEKKILQNMGIKNPYETQKTV